MLKVPALNSPMFVVHGPKLVPVREDLIASTSTLKRSLKPSQKPDLSLRVTRYVVTFRLEIVLMVQTVIFFMKHAAPATADAFNDSKPPKPKAKAEPKSKSGK